MANPYKTCHPYETRGFIIRLISEDDAEGLLKCYSDVKARPLFNSDMCVGDFYFNSPDEMKDTIRGWLRCYECEEFIRYSIICKETQTPIGTIEMFKTMGAYKVRTGVLRLDILSLYERGDNLKELFTLCTENFFSEFDVEQIVTKAIPEAKERTNSLIAIGFDKYNHTEMSNYYLLVNPHSNCSINS
ncbi:GNAT family N-acetyltransferase [Klebsiella oxytoca]|uniref:GNAT family N-acetyltransferase n=1 Tax=Klebsiella oxytoca TaxID=571 RepID=UPI00157ACF40|nr:hypothetical protein [Klebsiella oxytoca]